MIRAVTGALPRMLDMFIIDAFAAERFAGNPAAVCPLDTWLPDDAMQAIAREMNQSETVFFVAVGDDYAIRWFTPIREVDMIGHATLAAGHLVFARLRPEATKVRFFDATSEMTVTRREHGLALDMPAIAAEQLDNTADLVRGLRAEPAEVLAGKHYLCVFEKEHEVADLAPDFGALAQLDLPAVIVTAPASDTRDADFVSRFFAPANGVDEDPVSGVAHLCLTPYWAERLGKSSLIGAQLSPRGGIVRCKNGDGRVTLSGEAQICLEGRIAVP